MSWREHIEDELSLSYGVSAHPHLQKPIPQKLTPPLPILVFPAPSRPADRQDIVNLPPEKAVLHRVPARVVAGQQRAERVEHGGVVMERADEPVQERTAVHDFLLH
nr:hypothetical protein Itr_chr12CG24870 [Ipomoea trifida]